MRSWQGDRCWKGGIILKHTFSRSLKTYLCFVLWHLAQCLLIQEIVLFPAFCFRLRTSFFAGALSHVLHEVAIIRALVLTRWFRTRKVSFWTFLLVMYMFLFWLLFPFVTHWPFTLFLLFICIFALLLRNSSRFVIPALRVLNGVSDL